MSLALVLLLAASPVAAVSVTAPPSATAQTAWPCETEPRATFALHTYRPGAQPNSTWRNDPEVVALVSAVAPRRVEPQEAVARVAAFAEAFPGKRDAVAAGLIETIDDERRTIVAGVRRYSVRQAQLATRVEQDYGALDKATDQNRAALEEQSEWDVRTFEDRQRLLPIVCRQPDELEARLKALLATLSTPPAGPRAAHP